MAYTVPTGYRYYDASASKSYSAGQVFNGTAAAGDTLTAVDGSNKPSYNYEAAQTLTPSAYSSSDASSYNMSISAGFRAYVSTGFTGGALSLLDQIAGANVVIVNIYAPNTANAITITHIPNKVEYFNCTSTSNLTSISGTMPNTLKYFNVNSCSKLTSVPSLSSCTQWRYGYLAFKGTAVVTAPALPTGLQVMDRMFEGCTSLTTGAAIPSTVTRAASAYESCNKLTAAPANNSTIVENLSFCFSNCTSMTTAQNFNIRGANSLNATNIFYGCTALQTGPTITSADDLTRGFYNCINLTTISSLGLAKNLDQTFYNCTSLVSIPSLSNAVTNLYETFVNCTSLISTPDLSNVSLVTSLTRTFANCSSLTTITSFPQQPSADVLNCARTFENCIGLTIIPQLPNYIGSMAYMFSGCTSLQPQNIYIPYLVTNLNNCFADVINLSGIITLNKTLGAINNAFKDVNGPIIITGNNNLTNNDVLTAGNNIYKELNVNPIQVQAIRCSDTSGTLDDNGQYIHLIIDFESVVVPDTSLYVPKVYLDNDQQEPIVDWRLTNNNTHITNTIENSTSVQVDRVLAGDLITSGTFETYLNIGENEVLNYKIYIPSSADDVYDWDSSTSQVVTNTKYWNGIAGSAIFTSSTFIFDATPNGKSFKIGGPIDDSTETGFIVGNAGLPQADQFPSTFNGPVTINSSLALENYTHELRTIFNLFYPKGSYYETSLPSTPTSGHSYEDDNLTNAEIADCGNSWFDPRIVWGGTWVKDSAGRVTVAIDTSNTALDTIGKTGGNTNAIIPYHNHGFTNPTIASSGAHVHTLNLRNAGTSGNRATNNVTYGASGHDYQNSNPFVSSGSHSHTYSASGSVGYAGTNGNTINANLQPYIVVNRWHRTA